MDYDFLPTLPEGYHWQLVTEDDRDCTADYLAEPDAHEVRLWHENGDLYMVLKRTGSLGYWCENGLRRWAFEGAAPEGLNDWEQFETLSEIMHRLHLPVT